MFTPTMFFALIGICVVSAFLAVAFVRLVIDPLLSEDEEQ